MRGIFILAAMLPVFSRAQIFDVLSVGRVEALRNEDVRMAGMSRDGRYALVTSMSNKGLVRVSLQDGGRLIISEEEGAGIQPRISDDGGVVLHCSDIFGEDKLRRTALRVTDVASGDTRQLLPPTRDFGGYRLTGTHAEVAAEGRLVRRSVPAAMRTDAGDRPSVMSRDLRIQVTRGGETEILAPNGDGEDISYLWASLSPDGSRIAYYVSGEGTYVCGLNGADMQFISYECLAPQWYDDNTIVGMSCKDDGLYIVESAIVAYTLDGGRQRLTDPSLRLMYPFCSSRSGRIVCTSAKGEMYMLELSMQQKKED